MKGFSPQERKKISKTALAIKYGVSATYVRLVLRGKRRDKSVVARGIVRDCRRMLRILE